MRMRTKALAVVIILMGTVGVANMAAVAEEDSPSQATPTPTLDNGSLKSEQPVAPVSADRALDFLAARVDEGRAGAQYSLPRSYTGGSLGDKGFVSSFIYDDALTVIALLARGQTADVTRARSVGDAL